MENVVRVLVLFFLGYGVMGMTCSSGLVDSQNAMDLLAGCSSFTGDLEIVFGSDIALTAAFSSLTSIGGKLYVHDNLDITSLSAFGSLQALGSIELVECPNLKNADGLEGIVSISGEVRIAYCDTFNSLEGFRSLTTTGGISLNTLPFVLNVDGFRNLVSVTNEVYMFLLIRCESLEGFANVETVGSVYLYQLYNTREIGPLAFAKLTTIPGRLYLRYLYETSTISGFRNVNYTASLSLRDSTVLSRLNLDALEIVGGSVSIEEPYGLTYHETFPVLSSIQGSLYLRYPRCQSIIFPALTEILGYFFLQNNDYGYNTVKVDFPVLTTINSYVRLYLMYGVEEVHFPMLTSIGTYLRVDQNDRLRVLDAPNLLTIGDYVLLDANPQLSGPILPSVVSTGDYVTLQHLSGLNALDLFAPTATINGGLTITENNGLVNMVPNTLLTVTSALTIQLNPDLCTTSLTAWLAQVSAGSQIVSDDTAASCGAPPSCLGFVHISSAADWTTYVAASCTIHYGVLWIELEDGTTTLSASSLTEIHGDLYIMRNPHLMGSTADFLPNINVISGNLMMMFNDVLEKIEFNGLSSIGLDLSFRENALVYVISMNSLVTVGDLFQIYSHNEWLGSMEGFGSLQSVGGGFGLYSCYSLMSTSGLTSLTSLGSYLYLSNMDGLVDLDGFSALTTIPSYLYVYGLQKLPNLKGLDNLQSIGYYLYIRNNALLTDLSGLESLTSVSSYVYILDCSHLRTLKGLDALQTVGNYVYVKNNDDLLVASFPALESVSSYVKFYSNRDLVSVFAPLLNTVTSYVEATLNEALVSFSMPSLSYVDAIDLDQNTQLTTLDFSSLTTIENAIVVKECHMLTDLSAFSAVTTVGGLLLDSNNGLLNINLFGVGITQLTAVTSSVEGANLLKIVNNPSLIRLQVPVESSISVEDIRIGNNPQVCCSELDAFVAKFDPTTVHNDNVCLDTCIWGNPCAGNIVAKSNADLLPLATCSEVWGSLRISESVTSLASLGALTIVHGTMTIENAPLLTSFSGLEKLAEVEGDLYVLSMVGLHDMSQLNSLVRVGGELYVSIITTDAVPLRFPSLMTVGQQLYLYKLTGVTSVEMPSLVSVETLTISYGYRLTSLDFPSFVGAYGNIYIYNCDVMLSMTPGFPSLRQIKGYLSISSMGKLIDVRGLENLEEVFRHVAITSNTITSLQGLNKLMTVHDYIYIGSNSKLRNLDGLDALTTVGSYIRVYNNDAMNVAEVLSLTHVSGVNVDSGGDLRTLSFPALEEVSSYFRVSNSPLLVNVNIPKITSIAGYLRISNCASMIDLSWAQGIHNVAKYVTIYDMTNLISTVGFSPIKVSGYISVYQNAKLFSIDDLLYRLQTLHGGLLIHDNPVLKHIDSPVGTLTFTSATVDISRNPQLCCADVTALDSALNHPYGPMECVTCSVGPNVCDGTYFITSAATLAAITSCVEISGSVIVQDGALVQLQLPNLVTIGGTFEMEDCMSLIQVQAPLLTTIGGSMIVRNCPALVYLSEMSVTSIGGDLVLDTAMQLANISGFAGLVDLPGDLRIDNVDALPNVDLPFLERIGGALLLEYSSIPSLSGLSSLERIEGKFHCYYSNLENIDMPVISYINNVYLYSCTKLDDVGSLQQLVHLPGDIDFNYVNMPVIAFPNLKSSNEIRCYECTSLESVSLPQLEQLSTNFYLYNTGKVNAISAPNLHTIGGYFYIRYSAKTLTWDFSSLETIGSYLRFRGLSFTTVPPLPALVHVADFILIDACDSLENLDGFSALETVGSYVTVNGALNLVNMDGFHPSMISMYLLLSSLPNLYSTGDALVSLHTVGEIQVSNLLSLVHIPPPATTANVGQVVIVGTPQLCCDDRDALLAKLDVAGSFIVEECSTTTCSPAAGVCTGSYHITTLPELEALQTCTEVWGTLKITYAGMTDAELTTNLGGLQVIVGKLELDGTTSLTSFAGLSSLTSLGGLDVNGASSLLSLDGLEQALGPTLSSSLEVSYCSSLQNISALRNVERVEGRLYIRDLPSLLSFDGLESITTVGGQVYFNTMLVATSLQMPMLSSIGLDLLVDNLPLLETLEFGFSGVFYSTFRVDDCLALLDLRPATAGITEVRGTVYVRYDRALEHLGFEDLEAVTSSVIVQDDDQLQVVTFPKLRIVGSSLSVVSNDNMEWMRFPILEEVHSYINVESNNNLAIIDAATFPVLRHTNGRLTFFSNSGLQRVLPDAFPALTVVDKIDFRWNGALQSIQGYPVAKHVSEVAIEDNGQLEIIHLPWLESVDVDGVEILDNAQLISVQLPSLQSVQGLFLLGNNPSCLELDMGAPTVPLNLVSGASVNGSPLICCLNYFTMLSRTSSQVGGSGVVAWSPACTESALDCAGGCGGLINDLCGVCGGDNTACCGGPGVGAAVVEGSSYRCDCASGYVGTQCLSYVGDFHYGMRYAAKGTATVGGAIRFASGHIQLGTRSVRPTCTEALRGEYWHQIADGGDSVHVCIWTGSDYTWQRLI